MKLYAVFSSPEPGIYLGTWHGPDSVRTAVHGSSPIKYLKSPPTSRAVPNMEAAIELFREHGVTRPIFRGPRPMEGYTIGMPAKCTSSDPVCAHGGARQLARQR